MYLSTSRSSSKQTESSVNSTPGIVTNKQATDKPTIASKPSQIIAEKMFNLTIILWLSINTARTIVSSMISRISCQYYILAIDSPLTSSSIKDFHIYIEEILSF